MNDGILYGQLNDKVKTCTYRGGTTDTATVIIDANNVIKVDTIYDDSILAEKLKELKYKDSPVNQYFVTSVSQENGQISVTKKRMEESDIEGLAEKMQRLTLQTGQNTDTLRVLTADSSTPGSIDYKIKQVQDQITDPYLEDHVMYI